MTSEASVSVPLTRGYTAIVDPDDAWVLQHKWYASVRSGGRVYAARSVKTARGAGTVLLHRVVMGASGTALHVDHINGDSLDNRRANLRAVTPQHNHWNIKAAHDTSKSGVMGVYLCRRTNRWHAAIKTHGKTRSLGYFDDLQQAAAVRLAAEREVWGIQPRRAHLHAAYESVPVPPATGLRRNNTSGQTGVSFSTERQAWTATLKIKHHTHFLGRFATKEEAIEARLAAERQRVGSDSTA